MTEQISQIRQATGFGPVCHLFNGPHKA